MSVIKWFGLIVGQKCEFLNVFCRNKPIFWSRCEMKRAVRQKEGVYQTLSLVARPVTVSWLP